MDRYNSTKKVAILGIVANIFLVTIKIIVGFISRSQAMIADGLNSAGDVFASLITYIGSIISSKPKDNDHHYGHGKAEYVFSMIISFAFLFVAINIFKSSLNSILEKEVASFSWNLILVATITIIIKLVLFVYCNRVGKEQENLLVMANAVDHRNDIFVTSSVLISVILGKMGVYWIDGVIGMGISIWVILSGFKIFLSAYDVLMDKSIDENIEQDLKSKIEEKFNIYHVDSITSKPTGLHYLLIIKVSVNGNMSVFESHEIASDIKYYLKEYAKIDDVIVHINPH